MFAKPSASPSILVGLEASAKQLAGVMRSHGFVVATEPPSGAANQRMALLVADVNDIQDENHWRPPYCAWIETLDADGAALAELVSRADKADFFFSFGALASAGLPIACLVADLIARRRPDWDIERRQDFELALHEAVSNALVHGNLGVDSMRGLSIEALDEYSRAMSQRLSDPDLARRRVEVIGVFGKDDVDIDVIDEGAGYDSLHENNQGACGRGLTLIKTVAERCDVHDGGRRLSMRFGI